MSESIPLSPISGPNQVHWADSVQKNNPDSVFSPLQSMNNVVPMSPTVDRAGLTQTFLIPHTLMQKPDEKPVGTSE